MTSQQKQEYMQHFAARHRHAAKGIKAAASRVKLYADGLSLEQGDEIRQGWSHRLEELAAKYHCTQTPDVFINDVIALKSFMNATYPGCFFEGEFTYARAQKSLSVKLKYHWCHDNYAEPPLCPIDSQVLALLGRPYSSWRWTQMSVGQYVAAYLRIKELAIESHQSIAEWELENYH